MKKKNRIAIILDSSASMHSLKDSAVKMFNDQVSTIKKASKKMDTTITLITFNNTVSTKFFNKPVSELRGLEPQEYIPSGGTALYDAMGQVIKEFSNLPEYSDPDCSFLLITITDGEENASLNFTGPRLADHIDLLQKAGRWTFTFCGANIDVEKLQQQLHIPKGNTVQWAASAGGMRGMSAQNSGGLDQYFASRNMGSAQTNAFYSGQQGISSADNTQAIANHQGQQTQDKQKK